MATPSEKEPFMNGGVEAGHLKEPQLRQRKFPLRVRILHRVEDFIDDIPWLHVAFKICAFSYFFLLCFITWQVLPLPGHWTRGGQSDKIPITYQSYTK